MRIWTWNIAGNAVNLASINTGMCEQVAAGALSLDPDFICLQEVAYTQFLNIGSRMGTWDQTAVFSSQADGKSTDGSDYGIALFSKWATTDTQVTILGAADTYNEIRRMISVKWGSYRVGSVHPTPDTAVNAQLGVLKTAAEAFVSAGEKVYIGGDFNQNRTGATMSTFWSSPVGWKEADDPVNRSKIDMVIFADSAPNTWSEWILDYAPARTSTGNSSDHHSVVADINKK